MFDFKSIPVDAAIASSLHWKHQQDLALVSRQTSEQPHYYARQAAVASRRNLMLGGGNLMEDDGGAGSTIVDMTKNFLSSAVMNDVSLSADSTSTNNGVSTPVLSNSDIVKKTGSANIDAVNEELEDQRIRVKENDDQLWTGLDLSGQRLISISDKVFNYSFLRRLYLNGNRLKTIPKSIYKLKSLRILDLSNNDLTELPNELGKLFNLRYLYLFDNDLKDLPSSFSNLLALEFLGLEGNSNINREIVNIIAKKGTRGLIMHLRDYSNSLPKPSPRKWIEINEDGEISDNQVETFNLHDNNSKSFTIMSYNTLCQHYATQKMYKYTPSWVLNWDRRREKLTEEIIQYKPNVICLQEVETRTYEEHWVPLMLSHGYKGSFHVKTRAKTMSEKNAKKVDGCAIFYQEDVFKIIDKKDLEYGSYFMGQRASRDVFNRFQTKDNVANLVVLQHINSGNKVIVANTHLHWDPEFNDVKALQVAVLLEEIQGVVKHMLNSKDDLIKIPLVICGDFNSQNDSAVYQFISQGTSKNHLDLKDRDYGKYTEEGLTHPFHLKSAYDIIGELPFTNFTPTFTEVIDYIWYSMGPLAVRGVLGGVDSNYTNEVIGFPSEYFPSDHIPLVTRFEFQKMTATAPAATKRGKTDFGFKRKT